MSPSTFLLPIVFLGFLAVPFVSATPAPALVTVLAPLPETVANAAHILGVDAAGHTTYAIDQPLVQGSTRTLRVFTATLVAGSDYASETISATFTEPGLTLGIQAKVACTVGAGNFICEDTDTDGKVATTTINGAATSAFVAVLDVKSSAMPMAGISFSALAAGAAAIGLFSMTL